EGRPPAQASGRGLGTDYRVRDPWASFELSLESRPATEFEASPDRPAGYRVRGVAGAPGRLQSSRRRQGAGRLQSSRCRRGAGRLQSSRCCRSAAAGYRVRGVVGAPPPATEFKVSPERRPPATEFEVSAEPGLQKERGRVNAALS